MKLTNLKYALAALALIVMAPSIAHAQLYILGETGFNIHTNNSNRSIDIGNQSYKIENPGDKLTNFSYGFTLLPGVGYVVNSKIHVGGQLGFGMNSKVGKFKSDNQYNKLDAQSYDNSYDLRIGLTMLYIPIIFEKVGIGINFNLDTEIGIHQPKATTSVLHKGSNTTINEEWKGNRTRTITERLSIRPSLLYELDEHWKLAATFDVARLSLAYTNTTNSKRINENTTETSSFNNVSFEFGASPKRTFNTSYVSFILKYVF